MKKQSQFAGWQIGLYSYMKGDYEDFHALRRRENKPNSKPITIAGSDAEWIPAFAGMTNMESLHGRKF